MARSTEAMTRHTLALIELALEMGSPLAADYSDVPVAELSQTAGRDLRQFAERVYRHAVAILDAAGFPGVAE